MADEKLKQAVTLAASAALGFAGGALLWRCTAKPTPSSASCCSGDGGDGSGDTSASAPLFGEFSLQAVVRPNIARLVPYRCARDDYDSGILLDANENSLGSPLDPADANACATHLERYPSPYQWELRELYGRWRGVAKQQVFVGVGSDEAIDMLIRMVCVPRQDRVLILPPTYGMYSVSAAVNDVAVDSALLSQEFQFAAEDVLAKVTTHTKIIFICSPNNPTANDMDRTEIKKLLDSGFRGLVVVDEAYADFSDLPSYAPLVSEYPNLVVLQTFSKSWGLAGMRCGVAIAHEDIVATLNKMKAPYNLNKITSRLAVAALGRIDALEANVATIKQERGRVIAALEAMPQVTKVFPSSTNFVMFRTPNAKQVYLDIATAGVVIRYRGNCHNCEECLRATVGTREENDAMLDKLATMADGVVATEADGVTATVAGGARDGVAAAAALS